MSKKIYFGLILLITGAWAGYHLLTPQDSSRVILPSTMKLSSPAFENNSPIPVKFTCDGQNINPPLQFTDLPEKTQTLALIVDDPDAPSGNWDHWLLANLNPTQHILPNYVPDGAVVGKNSFGEANYGGPCPPHGTHHYQFKLYALDINLDLTNGFTKKDLEQAMALHILDQALLVGLYR